MHLDHMPSLKFYEILIFLLPACRKGVKKVQLIKSRYVNIKCVKFNVKVRCRNAKLGYVDLTLKYKSIQFWFYNSISPSHVLKIL